MNETTKTIDQEYSSLFKKVLVDPFNKEVVFSFLNGFERREGHGETEFLSYFKLKYIYGDQKWLSLNKIAEIYLENDKKFIAYMCLVESLRHQTNQPEIVQKVEKLRSQISVQKPEKLQENKCSVSVIMATYHRSEEVLRESIESYLAQTFEDSELIVVNDGGSQKVGDIVKSYQSSKIRYYFLGQNIGQTGAINRVVVKAYGKYIAYLDDDDVYYPEHLQVLYDLITQSQSKVAYSNSYKVEGYMHRGKFNRVKVAHVRDQHFDRDKLLKNVFVVSCSVMHEKSLFQEVGLFREEMCMSGDWEFWLRSILVHNFIHISKNTSEYRVRDDNVTSVSRLKAAFFGRVLTKYYAFHQGKVSLVNYYLNKKNKELAFELYSEIVSNYKKTPQMQESVEALIQLAFQFNDKRFLRLLAKAYFKFDSRKCFMEMKQRKSIHMLYGMFPYLPFQLIKSVKGRIRNRMIGEYSDE